MLFFVLTNCLLLYIKKDSAAVELQFTESVLRLFCGFFFISADRYWYLIVSGFHRIIEAFSFLIEFVHWSVLIADIFLFYF